MREIKFRAWNKEEERWYDVDKLQFGEDGIIDVKVWTSCNNSKWLHWAGEDFIVVQYTGRKDKNGKDIYEGDIFDSPSKNKFKVVWYKDGWFYQHIYDKKPIGHLIEVAQDWEIIGNIYENPELMKDERD